MTRSKLREGCVRRIAQAEAARGQRRFPAERWHFQERTQGASDAARRFTTQIHRGRHCSSATTAARRKHEGSEGHNGSAAQARRSLSLRTAEPSPKTQPVVRDDRNRSFAARMCNCKIDRLHEEMNEDSIELDPGTNSKANCKHGQPNMDVSEITQFERA